MRKMSIVAVATILILVVSSLPLEEQDASSTFNLDPPKRFFTYIISFDGDNVLVTDRNNEQTTGARGDGTVGSWGWDENGFGPFNSFYAAFYAHGRPNTFVARLDPNDLTKTIDGESVSNFKREDTDINVMWCIPKTYIGMTAEGDIVLTNDSSLAKTYNCETFGHDLRNARDKGGKLTHEYLAIGVYEATMVPGQNDWPVRSLTGVSPTVEVSRDEWQNNARGGCLVDYYLDGSELDGYATIMNWGQYLLYRLCAIAVTSSLDCQSSIGKGVVETQGDPLQSYYDYRTGTLDSMGPYYSNGYGTDDPTQHVKLFIEDAWGGVDEFIGDTLVKDNTLHFGASGDSPYTISETSFNSDRGSIDLSKITGNTRMGSPLTLGIPWAGLSTSSTEGAQIYDEVKIDSSILTFGGNFESADGAGIGCIHATDDPDGTNFHGTRVTGARIAFVFDGTEINDPSPIEHCIVDYDTDGGEMTKRSDEVVQGGKVAVLPTPTRTGYTFEGWYDGSTKFGDAGKQSIAVTTDVTVKAKWVKNPSLWVKVSYDAAGGIVDRDSEDVLRGGKVAALPTPTYAGFSFLGWYDGSTKFGNAGEQSTSVYANKTVTARWEKIASEWCTVTYDASPGSSLKSNEEVLKGGTITNLPTPTYTGYTFDGWYDGSTKFGDAGGQSIAVTTDVKVTAHWIKNESGWCTVSYDAGDGTASKTSDEVLEGGSVESLPTATRTGYTFGGWYDGGTKFGDAGGRSIAVTSDIRVTASWISEVPGQDIEGYGVAQTITVTVGETCVYHPPFVVRPTASMILTFEVNDIPAKASISGQELRISGATEDDVGRTYNIVLKESLSGSEFGVYLWLKVEFMSGLEIDISDASSTYRIGDQVWIELRSNAIQSRGVPVWSTADDLPKGLKLVSNVISGVPTEKFDGKVTVNLTVGEGTAAQSATKDWTVQVFAAIAGAGTETVRTDGTGAFASTPVENDAGLGVTWAVESVAGAATSMPDWMQLDAGTGVLSGTCPETAVASYTVALKGTSANDPSQTATRTVVVNHQPEQAITPGEGGTTIGEDEGIEGADVRIATYVGAEPKKVALSVKGATSGVVWSLPDDKPAYVSIDAATGEVTVDAGGMTDGQGETRIVVVTAEVNGARAECGVQIVIEDTLRVAGMTVGSSPVQTSKLQTMAGMPGSIDVSITGGSGNTVVLHEKGVQEAYAGTDIRYADGRLIAESASPIQKTMTLTVTSEGGQSADCDITVSVYKRAEFTAVPTVGDASSDGSD